MIFIKTKQNLFCSYDMRKYFLKTAQIGLEFGNTSLMKVVELEE